MPLCHSLALSSVDVQLRLVPESHAVAITAQAQTVGQTGTSFQSHGQSFETALYPCQMPVSPGRRIVGLAPSPNSWDGCMLTNLVYG